MEGPDVIQMMLFIGIDETVIRLKKGIKNYKAWLIKLLGLGNIK